MASTARTVDDVTEREASLNEKHAALAVVHVERDANDRVDAVALLGLEVGSDLKAGELDRVERLVLARVALEQAGVERVDQADAAALDLDDLVAFEHRELDARATVDLFDREPVQLELEHVWRPALGG